MDVKNELAKKAENTGKVKLTKSMSIADMIKTLEPEIARALSSVITPERFTRMALNALNNTPKLAECTQMSFLAELMNAAQLGLEPNTPLGQAYLIPYKNKGVWNVSSRLATKECWTLCTVTKWYRPFRYRLFIKMMSSIMHSV